VPIRKLNNSPKVIEFDVEDSEIISSLDSISFNGKKNAVMCTIDSKTFTLGRYLLSYDGPLLVDHSDRNCLNFRRINLRIVTHQQNCMNRKHLKNCSSQYKGVSKTSSGKWRSQISKSGKLYRLGEFKSEKTAAYHYDTKAKELFGEFAVLNFPEKL